jgi:hypothetical protein
MAQIVNDIESNSRLLEISLTLGDHTLLDVMKSTVHISSIRVAEWQNGIDAATLARNFGVGLNTAQKTLNVTTQ